MKQKDLTIKLLSAFFEAELLHALDGLTDEEVSISYGKIRYYWASNDLRLRIEFVHELDDDAVMDEFQALNPGNKWFAFGPVIYPVDEHPEANDGLAGHWRPDAASFKKCLRTEAKVAAIALSKQLAEATRHV